MMPSRYRLRSARSFDVIYKRGKSVSCESLVVVSLPSRYSVPKVGFVVSKKVGKAVVRNKVKRRLREAFYALIPQVKKGYNYIVLARNHAAELDYHALSSDLRTLLQKAGKLQLA